MPTYEYECNSCKARFEARQAMSDEALPVCPECGADTRRIITGGAGFVMKSSGRGRKDGGCSLESTGRTCCGRESRCGDSTCGKD